MKPPSKIDQLWYHLKGLTPPPTSPDAAAPPVAPPLLRPQAVLGGVTQGVERAGAAKTGTLSNWIVNRMTGYNEGRTRRDLVDRAEDLVANDAHAASAVQAKAVNISGSDFLSRKRTGVMSPEKTGPPDHRSSFPAPHPRSRVGK